MPELVLLAMLLMLLLLLLLCMRVLPFCCDFGPSGASGLDSKNRSGTINTR